MMTFDLHKFTPTLIALSVALLAGCAVHPDRTGAAFQLEKNAEAAVKKAVPDPTRPITEMPAQETIEAGYSEEEGFIIRALNESEPLPERYFKSVDFNEKSGMDILRLLLSGTGVNMVYTGTHEGNARIYGSVNAMSISGSLDQVVRKLSESLGFFYSYKDGVLKVFNDQDFILTLPPAVNEDTYTGMSNTIQSLGGFGINLDKINKTLLFKSDKRAYDRISQYFEYVRDNRPMIVYDIHIYQVGFNKDNQVGVSWSDLNNFFTKAGLGNIAITSDKITMPGSIGLSSTYRTSKFDAGVFANFLSTQGTLKIVSQPKISLMSGSKSVLQQGNSTRYVSEVGSNTSTALNTISVRTDTVLSGLSMSISSDFHDGTVYTRIGLSLSDLIKFNNFTALGTNLQLPQTSSREVKTEVRTKPGDTILIGGISSSETHDDVSGMPLPGGVSLPTTVGEKDNKSELVIVLTPRVIKFIGEKKIRQIAADKVAKAEKLEREKLASERAVQVAAETKVAVDAALAARDLAEAEQKGLSEPDLSVNPKVSATTEKRVVKLF